MLAQRGNKVQAAHHGRRAVLQSVRCRWRRLKLEQDLGLQSLLEVELIGVKGLHHLYGCKRSVLLILAQ